MCMLHFIIWKNLIECLIAVHTFGLKGIFSFVCSNSPSRRLLLKPQTVTLAFLFVDKLTNKMQRANLGENAADELYAAHPHTTVTQEIDSYS